MFASVSVDNKTGQSKQCGLVQFETNAMAKNAIRGKLHVICQHQLFFLET